MGETTTEGRGGPGAAPMLRLRDLAGLVRDLVDVLLPGNENWPSAGTLGVQAVVMTRLAEAEGEEAPAKLGASLLSAGAPFEGKDVEARAEVVRAFEKAEPKRFAWVHDATVLAYYESPIVVQLIDAAGHPYRLRPHLKGYALPRFDRGSQTPRHGRGHYIPTAEVRAVDTSALDLKGTITTSWGKSR